MIPQITIPYAVADFAEICERGFCYVDKTRFIPYLERYKAPVFLRPRRFGRACWSLCSPITTIAVSLIALRNCLGGLGSGPILRRSITNT